MKKLKEFAKRYLIGFVIGAVLSSTVGYMQLSHLLVMMSRMIIHQAI